MPPVGYNHIRLIPENVRKAFEHCSWCNQVKSRFSGKPVPEGIIKERLKPILESSSLCKTCDSVERTETKMRLKEPPRSISYMHLKAPATCGLEVVLKAIG